MNAGGGRESECGLSMIEALVVVTLTALIALMILPLAQRSSRDTVALSNREIDAATAQRGEAAFRAIMTSVSQPRVALGAPPKIAGNAAGLLVNVSSQGRSACLDAGVETRVALRIEQNNAGGALVCRSEGRRTTLLTWRRGQAAFAYSPDGEAWRDTPEAMPPNPTVSRASLVRFSLRAANAPPLTWVAAAGWTERGRIVPDTAQQAATSTAMTAP